MTSIRPIQPTPTEPTPFHAGELTGPWVSLQTWAAHHQISYPNAARLAGERRITGLGYLPGKVYLMPLEATVSATPQALLELDWTLLKVARADYPYLEIAATELKVPTVFLRGGVYTPAKDSLNLLRAFDAQRQAFWDAGRLAKSERYLAQRGLTRALLEHSRASFSPEEWQVLQMRYALGEFTKVHSLGETALSLNRTRVRVLNLEGAALKKARSPLCESAPW